MTQDTKAIVATLKQEIDGIKYLASASGNRHFVDVPIDAIQTHPLFVKIRGEDPQDLSLLRSSMKEMGGPLYMPAIYIELDEGKLAIFVADGHQRFSSAKANGDASIACTYVDRWDNPELAFQEIVGVQWGRYEPTEADIVSILRSPEN